jgi:hypothetical protein
MTPSCRSSSRAPPDRSSPAALLVVALSFASCARRAPPVALREDASALVQLSVRVPGAIGVARALDTLSVAIDPASLALTQVTADAAMVRGVEAEVSVFAPGRALPVAERRATSPREDFDVGAWTWSTVRDGVPVQGTRYVVEMRLVLFETDVAPERDWDPRAGRYDVLWTRTLRQAEE